MQIPDLFESFVGILKKKIERLVEYSKFIDLFSIL